jgi:hypothetical protein
MTAQAIGVSEPRARRRGLRGWLVLGIVVVVVGLVGTALAGGGWSDRASLDPESAGPSGTRALARILTGQGIAVHVVRDRAGALAALEDGNATLVLSDAPYLSDEALLEVTSAAEGVVLLEPRARTLRLLLPGSTLAGAAGTDELSPSCDLPAAERAGGIVGGALATAGEGAIGCYPLDDGFALVTDETDGRTISALDGRALLANDVLAQAGNASLALAVVGARPEVVWFMPSLDDADVSDAAPTLGELTPDWVTPVMLLLVLAAVAAAIWRGRRFGPLVAEDLPVTVRASETTAGRARLYARSRDAGHALDQLRLGALERIGRMLGLAAHAKPGAVADAAAERLQADRATVRGILLDRTPRTDRELVELAERLRDLETRVHAAVRPERNTP